MNGQSYEWVTLDGRVNEITYVDGRTVVNSSVNELVKETFRLAQFRTEILTALQCHEDRRQVQKLMCAGKTSEALDIVHKWEDELVKRFGMDAYKAPEQWIEAMQGLPKVLRREILGETE